MKLNKPWFYDDFVCIASECTDNCCIGWEIDIDPSSMKRFSCACGEFGDRLRSAIHKGEDGVNTFAFGEGERCALLRDDGLCELILNMGEDSLCDICALHPRFFGWYNGLKEAGLGLCCEEVCRLMFSDSAPMTFVSDEISEQSEPTCDEIMLNMFLEVREKLFGVMQDRSCSLRDRMVSTAYIVREFQQLLDNGETDTDRISVRSTSIDADITETVSAVLRLYSDMESINAEWDERLSHITAKKAEIIEAMPGFAVKFADEMWRYEHIAVYFCYRYFLSGVFEGECVSRIGMMCAAVLSVQMMDCLTWLEKGELSEWDRILNLKLFSKQVEYSADNVEMLYDAVWDVADLYPEKIAACIC
ncbi:MAG: flagellin lysine-N-methylase [Oscillospiraceae bacterium]|nr:flagellin lysine-N-methylase [Oscillospiraceae bacterium]